VEMHQMPSFKKPVSPPEEEKTSLLSSLPREAPSQDQCEEEDKEDCECLESLDFLMPTFLPKTALSKPNSVCNSKNLAQVSEEKDSDLDRDLAMENQTLEE